MSYLEPWEEKSESERADRLKRFVYQREEDRRLDSFPHVLKPLASKQTVMGRGSPHQTGDLTSYDILTRGPCIASLHTSSISLRERRCGAFTDISPLRRSSASEERAGK